MAGMFPSSGPGDEQTSRFLEKKTKLETAVSDFWTKQNDYKP